MPIGVPKVPTFLPGEPFVQWVDLYHRLSEERVLLLCQDLEDELSNQLIGLMLYLSAEDSTKDLFLYINSPGGSVTCGLSLYDAVRYVKADVTTICVGTAASMASFILAGGSFGKRIALPHSRIMIHQPEGGSMGQVSEVVYESEQVVRIRRQIGKIYADRTRQSLSRISRDMDRDQFMSAREAKDYGIVDIVAASV